MQLKIITQVIRTAKMELCRIATSARMGKDGGLLAIESGCAGIRTAHKVEEMRQKIDAAVAQAHAAAMCQARP